MTTYRFCPKTSFDNGELPGADAAAMPPNQNSDQKGSEGLLIAPVDGPPELSRPLLNFAERGGATLSLRSLRPVRLEAERSPLGEYHHGGPPRQDRS
jgi:hypothetical protein